MNLKFYFLTFLLLVARGCDFYSTSLWFFENPTDETNPLTSIFGFGWTGLIVSNAIIVGLIVYSFYYYTFNYSSGKVLTRPTRLTDYVSELYFNRKGRFLHVFFKMPKNRTVYLGHIGYVSIRVIIIGSFLAATHNLCQFYNVSLYNSYSKVVGRPLFVIYGLIILSIIYFYYRLWTEEFENAKINYDSLN